MAWWTLIGSAVIGGWSGVQLWRAWKLGRINAGIVEWSRSVHPISFWLSVTLNLIVLFGFGGGILIVAAHDLGLFRN
jgi:hypothetical protein